jgi:hypothetical protein
MEETKWGNHPLGMSVLAVLALAGGALVLVGGGLVVGGLSTPTVHPYIAFTGFVAAGALTVVTGILGVRSGVPGLVICLCVLRHLWRPCIKAHFAKVGGVPTIHRTP